MNVAALRQHRLTDAQMRACALADKKLAEHAGWDMELLASEAADMAALGIDVAGIGFDLSEIDCLLDRVAGDEREVLAPDVPTVSVSSPRTGDVLAVSSSQASVSEISTARLPFVREINGGATLHAIGRCIAADLARTRRGGIWLVSDVREPVAGGWVAWTVH